jgi:hypothetical protein
MSPQLGAKIKNMTTANEMWDTVKANVTTKSTLYIINTEDQLTSMQYDESPDPKTHLTKL